jgi:hypothetical protein
MRLRSATVLGLAIALCAMLSQATQAENGRPSRQMLEQMGCGSLVVMSDEAALAVRGEGFKGGGSYVRVSGSSWATIGTPDAGAHSENAYFAEGKHDAKGSNSSYAGVVDIWSDSKGGGKDKGGNWGGMDTAGPRSSMKSRGGDYGGGKPSGGGYGGGNVKIHATIFFSGGHSSAWAN